MADTEDAEITLGTGKLLAMFFALVVVCAVFFGLGYALGRSGARPATAAEAAPQPVASTADKPSALKPGAPASANAGAPAGSDELPFYQSVEQNQANPQFPAAAPPPDSAPSQTGAPTELIKPAPGAFVVQVAAVSKQEDADMLVNALKKKQYPVFVTTVDTDKLFHVQVGPFADQKEAEVMKAKLTGDGYSPILKR